MNFKKVEEGFLVRLDRGEEVVKTLTDFVRQHDIKGGFLQGMGAFESASLGVYDLFTKGYITKSFRERLEVGMLNGNIARVENSDEIFIHMHVTVGDSSLHSFTGHVFEAIVLGTLEVFIRPLTTEIIRRRNDDLGFNAWHL
jgi:predicted DNA-binding protein with PD1-like motif